MQALPPAYGSEGSDEGHSARRRTRPHDAPTGGRKRSKLVVAIAGVTGASRRFIRSTKDSVGSAFSAVSWRSGISSESILSAIPSKSQFAVWSVVGGTIAWAALASVLLMMASLLYK